MLVAQEFIPTSKVCKSNIKLQLNVIYNYIACFDIKQNNYKIQFESRIEFNEVLKGWMGQ